MECRAKVFTRDGRLLVIGTFRITQEGKGTFIPDPTAHAAEFELDASPQRIVLVELDSESHLGVQYELHNWRLRKHFLGPELAFQFLLSPGPNQASDDGLNSCP